MNGENQRIDRSCERIFAAWAWAALLTLGAGALMWQFSRILPTTTIPEGAFPAVLRAEMRPEPRENFTYIMTVLLSPLIAWGALKLAAGFADITCRFRRLIPGILVLCGIGMSAGSEFFPVYFNRIGSWWLLWLAGGCAWAGWLAAHRPGKAADRTAATIAWGIAVLTVLAARIYTPEKLHLQFLYHLDIIAYAVSQAGSGAAQIHQYGYYPHWIAPLVRLAGGGVFGLSLVMALIYLIGMYAVFAGIRRVAGLLWASGWVVIFSLGANWAWLQSRLFDPYFAYNPVRFIFPALGFALLLRGDGAGRISGACRRGLLAGAAFWWNADSGIAVIGAGLFVELLNRWGRGRGAGRPGEFLATVLAVLAVGWAVLAGDGIDVWERTFGMGRIFYRNGFFMLPMPGLPSPWGMVLLVYLGALTAGIYGIAVRRSGALIYRCFAYLAVLGLGLFLYYQGRSHLFNLVLAAWPAWALLFMAGGVLVKLRRPWWELGIPACMLAAVLAGVSAFGAYRENGFRGLAALSSGVRNFSAPSVVEENVRFMLQHAGERRQVNVFGYAQGIYLLESGLESAVRNCGQEELTYHRNRAELQRALIESDAPLFVSVGPDQRLDFLAPVLPHYRLVARSSNKSMLYWEPLPKARR